MVTLTVTEAGYLRAARRAPGHRPRRRPGGHRRPARRPHAPVRTTPGRLVAGLLARRAAGAGGLTIVPCDNLPDNGPALATVLRRPGRRRRPDPDRLGGPSTSSSPPRWSTGSPRPPPTSTAPLVLAATGLVDAAPVPTEPFSEWVIQGRFAARAAGLGRRRRARRRRRRAVRAAQALAAQRVPLPARLRRHRSAGTRRSPTPSPTPSCWPGWRQWWDEAAAHLTLPADDVAAYRAALLDRFANPAIRHALAQIAADGSQKLPVRILPTLRAELAAGRVPTGATRVLAAWRRTCGAPAPRSGRPRRRRPRPGLRHPEEAVERRARLPRPRPVGARRPARRRGGAPRELER